MVNIRHFRFVLFFFMTSLLAGSSNAQNWSYSYNGKQYGAYVKRWTMGIGLGFTAYNGELSNFLQAKLQNYYLNPNFDFNLHYRFTDRLSVRGEMTAFTLYSESETDSTICSYEDFSFRSLNFEYYLAAVIDLFPKGRIDGLLHRWDAHLFLGIGHVLFIPRDVAGGSTLTGTQIDPTSCERSSGIDYSKLSAVFPMGLGVKRYVHKDSYFSFEIGYRGDEIGKLIGIEQSDFLDALKETGDNERKLDEYLMLNIKVNWVIGKDKNRTFNYNKYKSQKRY
ncbi:hypothetical protein ACFLU5_11745 [Bacteroidota bacterium]